MNKPLLLCLLMALYGQIFAQKINFQSHNEARASQLIKSGRQAPLLENDKVAALAPQESKTARALNTTIQSNTDFPEYWPDRLFIKLRDGQNSNLLTFDSKAKRPKATANDKLNGALQRHQAILVSELPKLQKAISKPNTAYQVVLEKPEQIQQLMQELNVLPEVEYVERVPYYVVLQSPNDPDYLNNNQYALNKTKAAEAYGIHTGNSKTLLAIVDDAVLVSHPDLAANINIAKSYDVADHDSDPRPPSSGANKAGIGNFSHGTHCAGIAGAVTDNGVGIASISNNKVSIIGVKCTRDAAPSSRAIEYATEGIVYAINQGARVVSMSFGGSGYSQTIQNIINEATANGIVFVAAAGNNNTESKMYPAAYDNVIAVASTDAKDLKSSFSNYGSWVDISAPGSGILSTVTAADGTGGAYNYYSGTSMACPMVASLVAFMLSENPGLTPQAVTQLLKATADPLEDVPNQSPGLAGKLGSGRINAYRAIQAVKGITNAIAPAAITDLHVIRAGQTELEIEWSAPDAGGTAASLYEVRYSTSPISAANFEAATKTRQSLFPDEPGRMQKLVVKELTPNTTYYVAIVAKSLYGNTSPLSNVVDASTLPAPVLQVNPNSYSLSLDRNTSNTVSKGFMLTNEGTASATYNAVVVPVAGSNILAYDKQQSAADNSIGLGGDSFISVAKFTAGARGFNLTHVQNFLNSSVTTGNVTIGIRILKGGTNPANATLLTSETFTTVIPAGGSLATFPLQAPQQIAPGEVFWIAFVLPRGADYPQGFDIVGSNPGTFYLSTDNGSSYEDAQMLASFLSDAAFKIHAANADWVTLSPVNGNIEPMQAREVNMAFDVSNLPDGFYQMHVLFKSNDLVNPEITRQVTLAVTGGHPKLVLESAEINFGTLFVGISRVVKVTIANTGSATLTVKPEAINSGAFAPTDLTINTNGSISLAPGKQQEVLVTFAPSQKEVLNGALVLSSNDPAVSSITVPITANVVSPPIAVVTPATLNFELDYGGIPTATEMVSIQNTGEAEVVYTLQALVDPLSSISYDANRQPDNYLGYGSQYPYIHTALKFDVKTTAFNLTHVQNYFRSDGAGNASVIMKVYKGGNSPTAGTLLLQQSFDAPASAVNGSLVTIPLQQPQPFKQGDVFWVVFSYSGFNKPQGYNTNTSNTGRNFYSSNGTSWYSLESAGGPYASSTYIIKALDMPQWLSISPGTGQVAAGSQLQHTVAVNAAGLQKGRYKGKVQVMTNDPNQPLITVEVNLQLEESPLPGFTANTTQALPGEAVTFLNSSKNADAYEWQFEGAEPASSSLASPSVVYSRPGKYKVLLKAKNTQTGRTSEALVKEGYVVVENTWCQSLNYSFDGNASLAINDDGYLTGNNKNGDIAKANYFNYNRAGAYVTGIKVKFGAAVAANNSATIKMAVWDVDDSNGNPQSIIASKEVKLTEVAADIAAGRVTDIVFDAPVRLTGSFFAGVLLNNEPGNSVAVVHNSNNETTPGIAWTKGSQNGWKPFGNVWPDLADIALYIQPAITQTITPILADFTISAESVCVGQQVELNASSTVGAVRYEWLLEGAAASSTTDIKTRATYTTAGTYRVTLKAYDACSGVVVISKNINVKELPDAIITAEGPTSFCAGESVTLTASEGSDYLWSNGATTRSIVVSEQGNYIVRIMNRNGCASTSEEVATVVYPLPNKPSISRNDVILTSNAAIGNQWFQNNIVIPGATGAVYEAREPGVYQVQVTNTGGCISEMSEELNVTEKDLITDLQVYPNPGNGIINITFTGLRPDQVNIFIFDTVGKVVYQEKKNMLDGRELQVDISTAAAGVYMLQLQHNARNYSRRIIVQR